jgi:hypothetical protein
MHKDSNILAGWASKDITPSKPVKLQGQFYERISEFIHDPITATALAIESDREDSEKEQLIIVSCDLLCITKKIQNTVRELVSSRISDFDNKKLFFNATHTHTAPVVNEEKDSLVLELSTLNESTEQDEEEASDSKIMSIDEYFGFLVERLADVVVNAWENRKPGRVSWALDYAVIGHNRRITYNDGTAKMYGTTDTVNFEGLEGASDPGIEMLYFWNKENEFTGVVINVTCPSQVVEHKKFISADYWSEVRKEIRKRYSDNVFVLPMCGAAGDQSPRDLVRRGRGEEDMWDLAGMKAIGIRIADAVDRKYVAAKNNINKIVCFKHAVEEIKLPLRLVGEKDAEEAKKAYEKALQELKSGSKLDAKFKSNVLFVPTGIIKRYEEQQKNQFYTMELHVIRLGNVVIATNPFELYLDYGLQIKARSKGEQTFIVQLACDSGGYLPTAKAISGGHYGTMVSSGKVGPEGGKVLVNRTVEIINEMF